MRVPYVANEADYRAYYMQKGGGAPPPVFQGALIQRGSGIGSIFGSLLRYAMPILKTTGRILGRHALRGGVNTIKDIARGQDPKGAFKTNLRAAGGHALHELGDVLQAGRGIKRQRPIKNYQTKRSRSSKAPRKKAQRKKAGQQKKNQTTPQKKRVRKPVRNLSDIFG